MPLVVQDLKTQIETPLKVVLNDLDPNTTPDDKAAQIADAVANAVHAYLLTATVTVTAQPSTVNVAGSAAAQTNPAPIVITGSLS